MLIYAAYVHFNEEKSFSLDHFWQAFLYMNICKHKFMSIILKTHTNITKQLTYSWFQLFSDQYIHGTYMPYHFKDKVLAALL